MTAVPADVRDSGSASGPASRALPPLVGREHHLAALEDALAVARTGRAVTVLVHGGEGAGKTALCRRFLEGAASQCVNVIEARGEAGALVPHATLEPIVAALAEQLTEAVPDLAALARMFPVLCRLPAAPTGPCDAPDPFETRRRAALALRASLAKIAAGARQLVIAVDDLHWGDADSASLLLDAIAEPCPPPVLLLLAYRSDRAAANELVAGLFRRMARGEPVGDLREVLVGPLSPSESRALARDLLGDGAEDEAVVSIARASGGNPRSLRAAIAGDPVGPDPLIDPPPDAARDLAAADRAAEALAFHLAAALYRRALDAGADPKPIRVPLARALAYAGRAAEAARAYLDASSGSPPAEALDLRRRAAEQLLRAGHVDEGAEEARAILAAVDLGLPKTPARAWASLLYRRARLSLRGLDPEERASGAAAEELARIDLCWSVGNALEGLDPVCAAEIQARHLHYALDAGDPYRASRALSCEAIHAAMRGGRRGLIHASRLLERARDAAARSEHPHAFAWAAAASAGVAFHEARFADAVALSDHAIRMLRSTCADITWEIGAIVSSWLFPALYLLGRLDDLTFRLPAHLKEAEDRGALSTLTTLRALTSPRLLLSADRPGEARREAEAALAGWSASGLHIQRWCSLVARASASLYEGDGPRAHAEVEAAWPALDASPFLRFESLRVDSLYLRGLSALAALPAEGALTTADRAARALGRTDSPVARPFSRALDASLSVAHGQLPRAAALLEEAERALGDLSMGLHAAAMRRRRGEILGGEQGQLLCESADAWMFSHGVERPDRVAAMLASLPGG